VGTIQTILGIEENPELVKKNLSNLISSSNVFGFDSDKLYYFVREGYVSDAASYTWRAEGYCKTIKVISELIDGVVQIDGFFKHDL